MTSLLLEGAVLGLSAGLAPGPLLALALSQTIRHGAREGMKVAVAPLLTDLPIILASVFLLGRVAGSNAILGSVTLCGGGFVAYLGCDNLRSKRLPPDQPAASPQSLTRGALVNALSPHPYLFWMAVGAPIILAADAGPLRAAGGFAIGFYPCLVGSKILLVALASRSRRFLLGRPYVYLMRALGIALLFLSILLLRNALELIGVLR